MEKNNERAMNRTKRNMRTKRNLSRVKDYAPQGVVAFLVLAALLLFFFILLKLPLLGRFIKNVTRALAPAIAGFIFAFIMSPMVRFFETKMIRLSCNRKNAKTEDEEWITKVRRRSRRWSILITLAILLSIISLLLVTIIPELAKSLKNLAVNLADYLRQLKDIIDTYLKHNPRVADALNPVITRFSDTDKLAASITDYIDLKMAGGSIKFIANSAGAVVRILYIWLVGTIVAVYLLASKEYYIGLSKKLFFAILPKRTSKNAIQTLHKANIIYSAAILGKLVDSIIIGMICFIGTSILGFWFPAISEYKVLVSVIVGVTNVIPFFGPFLGGIPCSILILAMRPLDGLIFALFIVALQQFDGNFLDPHIVGIILSIVAAVIFAFITIFVWKHYRGSINSFKRKRVTKLQEDHVNDERAKNDAKNIDSKNNTISEYEGNIEFLKKGIEEINGYLAIDRSKRISCFTKQHWDAAGIENSIVIDEAIVRFHEIEKDYKVYPGYKSVSKLS